MIRQKLGKGSRLATLGVMLGGGLALGVAPAPATAQERSPAPDGFTFQVSERARLGVYLRPGCDVDATASGDCPVPPIVASVVDGAPAAEAGIQPGDTLLSLDGASLRSERGRRAMGTLKAGEPVRLLVGRPAGRRELTVMPTSRPPTGLFQLSGTAWRPAPPSNIHVFRMRDEEGGVAEFHFAPEAPGHVPRPGDSDGFVVFQEGEGGTLRVDFGRPDVEVFTPAGERIELAELERRVREAREGSELERGVLRRVTPDGSGFDVEVEVVEVGGEEGPRRRLILENAPLARRLQSVHEEALVAARTRIDSVIRRQSELARRGELPPPAAAGYAYVVPRGDAPGAAARERWRHAAAPADYRLAGAEFHPLTPELAEHFPVAEGLLVLRVIPGTPAHRLGLRGGDVVVEVGGHRLPDIGQFRALVAESQAGGAALEVKWNRKGTVESGRLTTR